MRTDKQQRRWTWIATIFLLWLLFAQALGAARASSITFDEGPHLAVGYATLRTRDLRLQPVHIHPPLANVLAAAPLLLNPDLPDPRTIDGWEINSLSAITDTVVWQYPHPARLALAGRLPIILLTLLGGALVWRWAADLTAPPLGPPRKAGGRKWGGLLALALYTLDPNIIAHGSLVTTDMAVTTFGLLTFFLLHRYTHRPTRTRLIGVGLALGLALASKVSAILLALIIGAVLLVKGRRRAVRLAQRAAHAKAWRQSARDWLIIGLTAFVVLWAAYGFELRPLPDLTGSLPLPAATHVEIYRSLQEHYDLGHPAFLVGQNSDQGWWYYFPVAFLVKTPLPALILLGVALLLFVRRRRPTDLALLLFPFIYLVTALFSSVNIGYRHLLPILPFIYIFIGSSRHECLHTTTDENRIARGLLRMTRIFLFDPCHPCRSVSHFRNREYVSRFPGPRSKAEGGTFYALLLWLAIGAALVHPYPLTFFNALAGGTDGGYRWLADSNLDWGQNLWQLRDWMRAEGVEQVYYSHFSPARPEVYGVSADWLPPDPRAVPFAPFDPAPGVYAIGATTLQGVYTPDVNTYAWFRSHEPIAQLGHALFLYRVPEHPALDWAAVCLGLPLSDQQIRAKFGQPDLRLLFYDCAQSQVYPVGDEGRYLLPPEAKWPDGATPVLQARQPDGGPIYDILQAGKRPVGRHGSPATLDGPLTFLGYDVNQTDARPGQEIILRTWWQVEQSPHRPLSLMAHLVGPDGVPIAVGDGLGVPVEGWQPGDVIVQCHPLPLPQNTQPGEYQLYTGVYWLDTGERWPVQLDDETVDDKLLLDKIAILD